MSEAQAPQPTPVPTPAPRRHTFGKTVLYILIGFVALVGVFLVYVSMQPEMFAISRTAILRASPERVFEIVNDFHKWQDWSPWAKLDSNCKTTFTGPDSGVGAEFAWDGNSEVGQGSIKITESRPNELIKLDLVFIKPMEGKSVTEFTFQPDGEGTRVTWTMSGKNEFIGKLFSVLMDCDKMIGGSFEKGFDNMKTVLTSKPAATSE